MLRVALQIQPNLTADDNIGVVSDGTDTLKVRLAKILKVSTQ